MWQKWKTDYRSLMNCNIFKELQLYHQCHSCLYRQKKTHKPGFPENFTANFNGKMSPEELDKQYSPSRWVTRLTPLNAILSHVARLQQGTVACELSSPCVEKDVRYSDVHIACTLDLHHPQTVLPSSPLLVYIHGGYWCAGVLEHSGAWMANCLISRTGCSVAAVEYGLCDRVFQNGMSANTHVGPAR